MLNIGEFARLGQVSPRMLRHYDEIGLLRPEQVDASTGYRLYDVRQLERLHRIIALRDMGFGLERIGEVLSETISVEELRGMLRLRRVQIERSLGEEEDRLRRIEAHLRALEWSDSVNVQDVIIKQTQPVRVAYTSSEGLTQPEIADAFGQLVPKVVAYLDAVHAKRGISIAEYEDDGGDAPEGEIVLNVGFEIGDQDVPANEEVHVGELPVIEVAAATYRGGVEGFMAAWEALLRWIDDGGYRPVGNCRELYHIWDDNDSSRNLVELQQPIVRR